MSLTKCCSESADMNKGPWKPEEDRKLLSYIEEHGHGNWRALPKKAGLRRCGKSCRLRWKNYLCPDIKRGKFTSQEEQSIINLHALLGNRWAIIASHLSGRTDNEIKNYWNTYLKKRLTKMGLDPTTHKPRNHALLCGQPKESANLCHMAQWESARIEAEARHGQKPPSSCSQISKLWPWTAKNGSQTQSSGPDHTADSCLATSPIVGSLFNGNSGPNDNYPIDSTVVAEELGFSSIVEGLVQVGNLPSPTGPQITPAADMVVEGYWGSYLEDDESISYWDSTMNHIIMSSSTMQSNTM